MSKFNAAFWKWFGDSKVVDKNGDPLVVYHGTQADFNVFRDTADPWPKGGRPWFTSELAYAKKYSLGIELKQSHQSRIVSVFLKIENPLVVGETHPDKWMEVNDSHFYNKAKRAGFDGIFALEGGAPTYFPFYSNQIKSVDNDGTWDADDPDIRSNPEEDFGESDDIMSDEWMARLEKAINQSVAKILKDAGDSYVVHLKRKDGSQLFVSQTANSGKNAYQVSWVDKNDIPSMDTLFKTREAALISIAGGGPSPSIGQPGEWKVIETRKRR